MKKKARRETTTGDLLEKMGKEGSEIMNKYIKEVDAKKEENRNAKDDEDDGKDARKIEENKEEDEQTQGTRKREREGKEMVIGNISFDLSKV